MFAHQVITDLQTFSTNRVLAIKENTKTISAIITAQKFSIEDADGLHNLFKSMDGERVFDGEFSRYMRLPYELVYLDWRKPVDNIEDNLEPVDPAISRLSTSSKRACLVWRFHCDHIWKIQIISYIDSQKAWMPSHYTLYAHIGGVWGSTPEGRQFVDKIIPDSIPYRDLLRLKLCETENVFPVPYAFLKEYLLSNQPDTFMKTMQRYINEDSGEYTAICSFLILLNCKNIRTEKHYPSDRLNKRRIKDGKLPLFTYHTLRLDPLSTKTRASCKKDGSQQPQRLHFCRGHFKEFTTERPLFGKLTGLYWWEPQVRGNKKLGIIAKDYEVRV